MVSARLYSDITEYFVFQQIFDESMIFMIRKIIVKISDCKSNVSFKVLFVFYHNCEQKYLAIQK